MTRERNRDDRQYDTTQLHEKAHGASLHRDYSAHFFRWSFARNFIRYEDNVLEVGCGEDKPLSRILTGGAAARVNHYTGVDLNKLKDQNNSRIRFIGEFNFVERYKELLVDDKADGFDVLVTLEVIEHMHVLNGIEMLKACYECVKPGGVMIISTPVYDGKRHAANHIHEYTVEELQEYLEQTGFVIEQRYGTFMDVRHIGKQDSPFGVSKEAIKEVYDGLSKYFSNDALSNIFGPLYPDHARNNIWICRKEKQ